MSKPENEEPKTYGLGRFANSSFKRPGQKHAERYIIVVPHELVHNPDFPFKDMETVLVKLGTRGKQLIVQKIEG